MIKRTIRVNDYLYSKLRVMSKYYNMSINQLMIELMELGYIEREKHSLIDLKKTYFTVEQIKRTNNEEVDPNELINEKKEQDKSKFKKVIDDVLRVIGSNEYKLKYLQKFFQTYIQIETNKKITKLNQNELMVEYESEFHFVFDLKGDKQIINIYLKKMF